MVEITIRQIEAGDTVTGLSLGHEDFTPLKSYLQKDAKKHHEQSLARTYGVFLEDEPRRVKAYITLVCGEIVTDPGENGPDGLVAEDGLHYPYRQYPAVKIARLAVDKRLKAQNLKIGSKLVELSIGISKDIICPAVGCRFVVVDAKKRSIGFYERCGFTALDTRENMQRAESVMFVDLHKIG
ncbi:GNAT family N-acetyltransferase [Devosia geojensis]|uniref:GNAT family N-acetyltransferase n=1 Tax=Devosia geojensis TaxID=443610 RepID=UPI0006960D7B|nr:GNAT family N-acetyltransferase [Devosia geojensis]